MFDFLIFSLLRNNIWRPIVRDSASGGFLVLHSEKRWHSREETPGPDRRGEVNLARIAQAKKTGRNRRRALSPHPLYSPGGKVQRAEARFDGVAGCLRTPAGGSSRQSILVVEGKRVRSRLISAPRDGAAYGTAGRLLLPEKYNEAYHLSATALSFRR